MVGNCKNLSQTNRKWNEFCNENYEELYKSYQSYLDYTLQKLTIPYRTRNEWKFEMVQGPFPGLAMKYFGQDDYGYILDLKKTVVSFRYRQREFALKSIYAYNRFCFPMEFIYETRDSDRDQSFETSN
jgi:hypothetical protein